MDKTGRVDCECGDQIISNSGKTVGPHAGMIKCWNPDCRRTYDSEILEKARKENEVVVFIPPGKDLKVFRMNDCDWWMDKSLEEAKKNYPEFVSTDPEDALDNPYELDKAHLKLFEFYPDEDDRSQKHSFLEELQRRQSISNDPGFFASTEY